MAKIYCFDGMSQEGIDELMALVQGAKDGDTLLINKKPSQILDFNPKEDKIRAR